MNSLSLLTPLTLPLSLVWHAVASTRSWLFDVGVLKQRSFATPTICVGNLAVGGTGKTPHVEYILRLLHEEGYNVAMLSRGYGRRTRGFVLAERGRHTAADVGDEPFQVMQNCPFATVAVCEKRVVGMEQLEKLGPEVDVVVLDDAFQHRYVKPGLSILLTDAHRLYTHDHLLPWGRLREPRSAATRADVLVVTKCTGSERPFLPKQDGQSLFYSKISYGCPQYAEEAKSAEQPRLTGQSVLLIAGIANPQPLVDYLQECGATVTLAEFRDHHNFTSADAERINRLWKDVGGTLAVTTQKDISRLREIYPLLDNNICDNMVVQPIRVEIEPDVHNSLSFNKIIIDYVRANKRNSRLD